MQTLKGGQAERSGFRDQEISGWVRGLGDVPFADLDFIGVTFNQLEPVALIDWKRIQKLSDGDSWASLHAMTKLADRAQLPFFVVGYPAGQTYFWIRPYNDLAKLRFPEGNKRLTPRQMVQFMYSLSGREASAEKLAEYPDVLPDEVLADQKAADDWFHDYLKHH